jgi:hypothetical protein
MRKSATLSRLALGAALAFLPGCLSLQGDLNLGGGAGTGSPSPGPSSAASLQVKDYFFPPSATFKSTSKATETNSSTVNGTLSEETSQKTKTTTIQSYSGLTAKTKEDTSSVTTKKSGGNTTTESTSSTVVTDVTLAADGSSVTLQEVGKSEKYTITNAVFAGEPASFKQKDTVIKLTYLNRESVSVGGKSYDAVKFKMDVTLATSSVSADGKFNLDIKATGNAWFAKGVGQIKGDSTGTITISGTSSGVAISGSGTLSNKEELDSVTQ